MDRRGSRSLRVWDMCGNFGEYLRARCAYDVKKQRRIPRANQRLRDPFRSQRNSHDPGSQRCAIERDLAPTLAHVCDSNPAQLLPAGPGWLHERAEVKDPLKEFGWQRGDRREGIATRKQRTSETHGCIYFLIDSGDGCGTRCWCLSHSPDLVQPDFKEGDQVGEC